MQIKKVDWINKPESVKERAHSLKFHVKERTAVLYTLEESGELKLIKHNDIVSFLMLHTKEDRIIFNKESADIKMFSLSATVKFNTFDTLTVKKDGSIITFNDDLKIENPAFFSSASFGFLIEKTDEEILLELY